MDAAVQGLLAVAARPRRQEQAFHAGTVKAMNEVVCASPVSTVIYAMPFVGMTLAVVKRVDPQEAVNRMPAPSTMHLSPPAQSLPST
jgi:hypothetical protein